MAGRSLNPVVNIRPETQPLAGSLLSDRQFDRGKGRVLDGYADLLGRSHKNVPLRVLVQNCREEPHELRPADGCAAIIPSAVAGDAHIDLAAKWRVPCFH